MSNNSTHQASGNAAENYAQIASAWMLPWAENLVASANLTAGERVLDLACGTGFVGRTAKPIVGAEGVVIGVDLNPMMVAVARSVTGLDVREVSADATGLDSGSFDVVACQQGLQYFPDPRSVLRESIRCLRAGGRARFSVWAGFTENPFITGQIDALKDHLPPEAVAASRRTNIDSLGGEQGVASMFEEAGFVNVGVVTERLEIHLPSMAEFFPKMIATTSFAPTFEALSDGEKRAVIEKMRGSVSERAGEEGTIAHMTAVVAGGSRLSARPSAATPRSFGEGRQGGQSRSG